MAALSCNSLLHYLRHPTKYLTMNNFKPSEKCKRYGKISKLVISSKSQVKDAVICQPDPPAPPPPKKKKINKKKTKPSQEIFVKTVFFHQNMNTISFYKLFMVHYDYLIERYVCSMAFSAFTRHHLQFFPVAHQILLQRQTLWPSNMPKGCGNKMPI